jgi:Eukaryotic aspartyl protease
VLTVGEPAQNLYVLPSTSLSETYLVGSGGNAAEGGCPKNISSNRGGFQCDTSRGGLYNRFRSNTFEAVANTQNNSNYASKKLKGVLGREVLTVGSAQNGTVSSVVVFTSWDFTWVGLLGLNPRSGISSKTEQGGNAEPNLMQQLKASYQIPSLSYGYTAGSISRELGTSFAELNGGSNHTHGSLVLGGYDKTRFTKNNVSFSMGTNDRGDLMVPVQKMELISPSGDTFNSIFITDQESELWATIDSSQPYLYLPIEICNKIAQAFDLTWDPESDHYFFSNNTNPRQQQNLSLSFQIGSSTDTSSTVNITLPYGSLKKPYYVQITPLNAGRYYFPMRNATNPGHYILGRTFLQDAYLVADYERNTFSLHEVVWPESDALARSLIQPIPSISSSSKSTFDAYSDNTVPPPTKGKPPMSKATIAAIAIGVFILLVMAVLALLCFRRHSRRRSSKKDYQSEETKVLQVGEMDSNHLHESAGLPIQEMDTVESTVSEMAGGSGSSRRFDERVKLGSDIDETAFELPATAITNSRNMATTKPE